MPKLFISYRRDDSGGLAGRLFDRLQSKFGRGSVFMDVDSIPFGVDFRSHLADAVGQCDALLAVIGDRWATAGEDGQNRLNDPNDFVRIEIEAALTRNIPVIPVLVGKTSIPRESELPASLRPLAYRNACSLDLGPDFHAQVDRLIRGLELLGKSRITSRPRKRGAPVDPAHLVRLASRWSLIKAVALHGRRRLFWGAAAIAAVVSVFFLVLQFQHRPAATPAPDLSSEPSVGMDTGLDSGDSPPIEPVSLSGLAQYKIDIYFDSADPMDRGAAERIEDLLRKEVPHSAVILAPRPLDFVASLVPPATYEVRYDPPLERDAALVLARFLNQCDADWRVSAIPSGSRTEGVLSVLLFSRAHPDGAGRTP